MELLQKPLHAITSPYLRIFKRKFLIFISEKMELGTHWEEFILTRVISPLKATPLMMLLEITM